MSPCLQLSCTSGNHAHVTRNTRFAPTGNNTRSFGCCAVFLAAKLAVLARYQQHLDNRLAVLHPDGMFESVFSVMLSNL